MTNPLPVKPSLEYLKAEAKDFLRDLRSGKDAALRRLKANHPRNTDEVRLADAFLVLAREYGFESWPKLKAHVENSRLQKAIQDLRDGKCCILFDDEGRENEGDFVAAAEKISAQMINFITKHGRGTMCLALSEDQAKKLNLSLVNPNRVNLSEPAFLTSIDAANGITTGVSAHDRAATVLAAISPAASIKSPGHIFPLLGHPQGLKGRRGHTEGSLELMKRAGLPPGAVICEILNDDGTMARAGDLRQFAKDNQIELLRMSDFL